MNQAEDTVSLTIHSTQKNTLLKKRNNIKNTQNHIDPQSYHSHIKCQSHKVWFSDRFLIWCTIAMEQTTKKNIHTMYIYDYSGIRIAKWFTSAALKRFQLKENYVGSLLIAVFFISFKVFFLSFFPLIYISSILRHSHWTSRTELVFFFSLIYLWYNLFVCTQILLLL